MNSSVIKFLLGLCLILLMILLAEWQFLGSDDIQGSRLLLADEQDQKMEIVLADINSSNRAEESFSNMVERPLFIAGRRPVEEIAETIGNDKVWGKIDDFVLVGIYSTADRLFALLREQAGSREYLKKAEGDEISGWTLNEIKADRVLLESEGKQQSIMLRKPRKPMKSMKPEKSKKPKKPKKSSVTNNAKPVELSKIKKAVRQKRKLNPEK